MEEIWTVKSILDWIEGYLDEKGDENPRLSARWLVSDATNLSTTDLYTHLDQPLSASERDVLRNHTRRRGSGEPLQYITGTTDFRFISVDVSHDVLIPRPETEVLVSEALASFPKPPDVGPASLRVLDVGCGTGCISCAIASEIPYAQVMATDISAAAVSLAKRNVEKLELGNRVNVVLGDLCAPAFESALARPFDLVISNPPYIPTAVLDEMDDEVIVHEPKLALDGGDDGLAVFRRLCPQVYGILRSEGVFACELHETCLEAAQQIAFEEGFVQIRIAADLAGRPRILIARKG